jgi:aconitase A
VGVGGLEAENVMLGRASWMRLPDIIGHTVSAFTKELKVSTNHALFTQELSQSKYDICCCKV